MCVCLHCVWLIYGRFNHKQRAHKHTPTHSTIACRVGPSGISFRTEKNMSCMWGDGWGVNTCSTARGFTAQSIKCSESSDCSVYIFSMSAATQSFAQSVAVAAIRPEVRWKLPPHPAEFLSLFFSHLQCQTIFSFLSNILIIASSNVDWSCNGTILQTKHKKNRKIQNNNKRYFFSLPLT